MVVSFSKIFGEPFFLGLGLARQRAFFLSFERTAALARVSNMLLKCKNVRANNRERRRREGESMAVDDDCEDDANEFFFCLFLFCIVERRHKIAAICETRSTDGIITASAAREQRLEQKKRPPRGGKRRRQLPLSLVLLLFLALFRNTDLDHRLERQPAESRRPRRGETPEGFELGGAGRVAGLGFEVHVKVLFLFVSDEEKGKERRRKRKMEGARRKNKRKKTRSPLLALFTTSLSLNLPSSRQSLFLPPPPTTSSQTTPRYVLLLVAFKNASRSPVRAPWKPLRRGGGVRARKAKRAAEQSTAATARSLDDSYKIKLGHG